MRLLFLRDRYWTPPEEWRITYAYKAGMRKTVKRAWGERMVASGDAVEIPVRRSDAAGR